MKIGAVIQCRFMSTRLPYKCLHRFPNYDTMLDQVIRETKKIRLLDEIVLAVPKEASPECLSNVWSTHASRHQIALYHDQTLDPNDVLGRITKASSIYNLDYVVRVTADDPFRTPNLANEAIIKALVDDMDYVSIGTSCYGEGTEVFSKRLLGVMDKLSEHREHLSNIIRAYTNNHFSCMYPTYHPGYDRLTLDIGADWNNIIKRWEELTSEACGGIIVVQAGR